jgi:flagellar hook assembly protein FlgD
MQQSEVKITDASGNLVFSTVSIGGQAVWNGKTLDGNRVQSGVYYVFATSSDGSQKTKTKILFIN